MFFCIAVNFSFLFSQLLSIFSLLIFPNYYCYLFIYLAINYLKLRNLKNLHLKHQFSLYCLTNDPLTFNMLSFGNGTEAREGHSAALIGKRLFIFCGCGKSEDSELYYDDLYILNTGICFLLNSHF